MHNNKEILQQLSKHLFWDVDIAEIDMEKHSRFITERVVARGNLSDFRILLKMYSTKRIVSDIVKIRNLDKKTLNFLSLYFKVKKEKFRCYN